MTVTIEKKYCEFCKEITFIGVIEKKKDKDTTEYFLSLCEKCKMVTGDGVSSWLVLRVT
jgi:hypothetical protein